MKIYVSAPLTMRGLAKQVAFELRCFHGHTIVSTWHDWESTPEVESAGGPELWTTIARTVREEVRACDVLVLLYSWPTDRHGHVWEAGYAEGLGKTVVLVPATRAASIPTVILCDRQSCYLNHLDRVLRDIAAQHEGRDNA